MQSVGEGRAAIAGEALEIRMSHEGRPMTGFAWLLRRRWAWRHGAASLLVTVDTVDRVEV